MLDRIKLALRISHDYLDDDINDRIDSAKKELIRMGVNESKVKDGADPLIVEAIKTYVQMKFTDDINKSEMFLKSWETQADNLRKSAEYKRESDE